MQDSLPPYADYPKTALEQAHGVVQYTPSDTGLAGWGRGRGEAVQNVAVALAFWHIQYILILILILARTSHRNHRLHRIGSRRYGTVWFLISHIYSTYSTYTHRHDDHELNSDLSEKAGVRLGPAPARPCINFH